MRVLATSVLSGLALSLLAACGTVPINASPQAGADLQPLTTAQSTFSTKFCGGFGGYGLGYGLGGCGLGGWGLGFGGFGYPYAAGLGYGSLYRGAFW